jgi:acyl-CoA synthetase (AMP-forming)/AMP-acid ligase II
MWKGPETIREILKGNAGDFPDREGLVSPLYRTGQWVRHTWKEIDQITDQLAIGLAALGLKKGQKLAFMHRNSAECYYAYLSIHKIGAMFVPINVRLVAREVEYIVGHSDADFIMFGSDFIPLLDQIRGKIRNLKGCVCIEKEGESIPSWAVPFTRLLKSHGTPIAIAINPEDEADLIYTSGTTGRPKGVVLNQANKLACGRMEGAAWGIRRQRYKWPRLQNSFPFFTSTGVSSVMMPWLYYGFTVILEPTFDVIQTLETIQRERSTIYFAAPSMLIFILDHPRLKEFNTSSIRSVIYGGSAMPEEVIRRLFETWPGVKVYNAYGLTEGGTGGICLDAADAMTKHGSIGLPWPPDQEARILDDRDQDMGVREVGEIVIRGPNVMREYYKDPESTREVLRKGWLHTGDLGYYDEDGYFYYTDRKKDMIVRGGLKVYPLEVENVLYEHHAVKQCAVVAKPHPKLGEDVLALVVLVKGKHISAEELIDFCSNKLADFKRPREIRFVKSIPTNAMGKVDKKAIRATYLNSSSISGG